MVACGEMGTDEAASVASVTAPGTHCVCRNASSSPRSPPSTTPPPMYAPSPVDPLSDNVFPERTEICQVPFAATLPCTPDMVTTLPVASCCDVKLGTVTTMGDALVAPE